MKKEPNQALEQTTPSESCSSVTFGKKMSPESYFTVFDVTKAGFKRWSFRFWPSLVVVGLKHAHPNEERFFRKSPPGGKKGFRAFFSGSSFFGHPQRSSRLSVTIEQPLARCGNNSGRRFIEGPAHEFSSVPFSGHANESFVVRGTKFEYSDYGITAGFNNTASYGGPIRDGLVVRHLAFGGEIFVST